MRKIICTATLLLIIVAMWTSVALANGGPHADYSATTDACAGCHQTHTAPQAQLLREVDPTLCLSCHGGSATGANTDVDDGVYENAREANIGEGTDGEALKGGGFVNWTYENAAGAAAVTSRHNQSAAFAPTNIIGAWGDQNNGNTADRGVRGANGVVGGFRCSACHDPHGSDSTGNWRIIKTQINGVAVSVKANNNGIDEGTKNYTADGVDDYGSGISSFCAACHQSYHETAANVGSDVTAQAYPSTLDSFVHRVDVLYNYPRWPGDPIGNADPEASGYSTDGGVTTYHLPLADNDGDATAEAGDTVTCLTCHVAHGSSVEMTGGSGYANASDPNHPWTSGAGWVAGETDVSNSSLLRLPNRGVCEVCHQKP